MRGEEADRVVAPVVGHARASATRRLGEELVHRQQLDRGDAEVVEVADHGAAAEPGVRAAQLLGHLVVQLGEALDVQLVDDRVAPRGCSRWSSPSQSKSSWTTTDRGIDGRRVAVAARERVAGVVGQRSPGRASTSPVIARAYGSSSSLAGLNRRPCVGVPRAVDAEAVALARPGRRAAAPCQTPRVCSVSWCRVSAAVVVEQADPARGRLGGVDREVRGLRRPGRAELLVVARPDRGGLVAVLPSPGVADSPGRILSQARADGRRLRR